MSRRTPHTHRGQLGRVQRLIKSNSPQMARPLQNYIFAKVKAQLDGTKQRSILFKRSTRKPMRARIFSLDTMNRSRVPVNPRIIKKKLTADDLNKTPKLNWVNPTLKFNSENVSKSGSLAHWSPDAVAMITKINFRINQTKMTRYGGVMSPRLLRRKLELKHCSKLNIL